MWKDFALAILEMAVDDYCTALRLGMIEPGGVLVASAFGKYGGAKVGPVRRGLQNRGQVNELVEFLRVKLRWWWDVLALPGDAGWIIRRIFAWTAETAPRQAYERRAGRDEGRVVTDGCGPGFDE